MLFSKESQKKFWDRDCDMELNHHNDLWMESRWNAIVTQSSKW